MLKKGEIKYVNGVPYVYWYNCYYKITTQDGYYYEGDLVFYHNGTFYNHYVTLGTENNPKIIKDTNNDRDKTS